MDSDRGWRPEQSQTRDAGIEEVSIEAVEEDIPEIRVGHIILMKYR